MTEKTETIWVNMIEGVDNSVAVEALNVGSYMYQIIENNYLDVLHDSTSIWEFLPGDIVLCRKQGDNMVAEKLIFSFVDERDFFTLVFYIVKSLGSLEINLEGEEIKNKFSNFLNRTTRYCKHPTIRKWCSSHGINID